MAATWAGVAGDEPSRILTLAGHSLRMSGRATGAIAAACEWMCPPARIDIPAKTPEWTLRADRCSAPGSQWPQPRQWTAALGERRWPRLAVVETGTGWSAAVGQYQRADELVRIEADRQSQMTRVLIPTVLADSVRWVDWLARVFFGTRMLADGWLLLHAASVGINGRAVLAGGSSCSGKSSLAHLACAQLGASFMADDLTFIRGTPEAVTAVGWPTRVCIPVGLTGPSDGAGRGLPDASPRSHRERRMLGPAEYCAAAGFRRCAAAPVAAAVMLERHGTSGYLSLAADPGHTAFMTDTLGLVGEPAASPGGRKRGVLDQLLSRVPILRVNAARGAPEVAPDIWIQLRGVLGKAAVA